MAGEGWCGDRRSLKKESREEEKSESRFLKREGTREAGLESGAQEEWRGP